MTVHPGIADTETTYHVARDVYSEADEIEGPFTQAKVLELIEAGLLKPDMLVSRNGGDWIQGSECP